MRQFVRVIVVKDDKYLLINEEKKDLFKGWLFPGGKIEPDESPENAALRELKEEINLDADKNNLKLLCQFNHSFNTGLWHGYYFICKDLNIDKLKVKEPNICHGYCFFYLDELKNLECIEPDKVLTELEVYNNIL